MTDIDWSVWHKAEPAERRGSGKVKGAAASVTACASGEVGINFNALAMAEFGFEKNERCDVFEGLAERSGWLLICKNPKGKFHFSGCGPHAAHGVRIRRFKPEWAPEFAQKKQWVAFVRIGPNAVAVELPDWFDRELRAAEQAEAAT